ncbi:Integrase catalytic domain-containing protein [Durusdinium trenchii]|uniref:Integrase catalytic domain-containing protein n=1 Tax=Durusdinium trenchii TaxID=1381693 RepID=A0ABP0IV71_9DINO
MAQPVYIWRKFLPHTIYAGRKGGHRFVGRPRWVGPGRVVFHELLPGREEQDRQHIVWVILGNRIYKTSIHSVRPLSEKEQAIFEAQGDNSHLWKQLSDVIPRREFIDITGEIPGPDEVQEPVLPEDPNESTVIKPKVRFTEKGHPSEEGYPPNYVPLPPPAPDPEDSELVNEYLPDAKRAKLDTEDTEDNEEKIPSPESLPGSRRASTSSKTPLLEESKEDKDKPEEGVIDDTPVPEPEVKKARTDEDSDPDQEDLAIHLDLNQAILDIGEGYVMNIDLDFSSNRQKKQCEKDPIAYLAKKVNGAEVNYKRLSPEERQLSENAKGGEVAIPGHRLREAPSTPLTADEVAACRAALGALQWVSSQTQIQACARVNLLLTELTVNRNMQVAKEINDLIKEIRSNPMDCVIVTLADQAWGNRPQGGSTGGLLTCIGGPEMMLGEAGRLNPIAWKTWRLKRKAISTNDGEIQATLEGEDQLFRTRWMWCQLNGCCAIEDIDILQKANEMVKWQFIKSQIWKLRYDPGFVCSEKKTRRQGLEAVRQMKQLQSLIPFAGPDSRKLWNWCDETGSIES